MSSSKAVVLNKSAQVATTTAAAHVLIPTPHGGAVEVYNDSSGTLYVGSGDTSFAATLIGANYGIEPHGKAMVVPGATDLYISGILDTSSGKMVVTPLPREPLV